MGNKYFYDYKNLKILALFMCLVIILEGKNLGAFCLWVKDLLDYI